MQQQKWRFHDLTSSSLSTVNSDIPLPIFPSSGHSLPLFNEFETTPTRRQSDLLNGVKGKRRKLTFDYDLAAAITNREIRLIACPTVDIHLGKLEIIELKLCWQHPQFGAIEHTNIHNTATHLGLLDQLALHSLTLAIEFLLTHRPLYNSIGISLSLTLEQLSNRSLINRLIDSILGSGLKLNQFIFQFNETATSSIPLSEVSIRLNQIRCQGIKVVIDAFGSGFSTLDFLNSLAVDAIKLDHNLVAEVDSNPRKLETLIALVQLCRRLQIRVTITGVDTALTRHALLYNGIAEVLVQGMLYSQNIELSRLHMLLSNELKTSLNYLAFSPEYCS